MLSQFRYPLLFAALLVGIFFYYHYDDILFKRPQSVHHWRQADCASLALNYYQDGMNFFQPQTHNLTSDLFTTGYTSTSEMPILYYAVAVLYKIFGYHEFLYRLLNLLIFFTGLFYLYKLLYKLIKHQFWAMCLPLLIFSSPVLAYYANNFLSNSAALGVVFIGWYYFMEYYRGKDIKHFRRSIFFFTIAGLLKITALLSLGAVIGIYLLEKVSSDEKDPIFSKGGWQFFTFTLAIGIVASWTAYAAYYNSLHGSYYFSTTIFPIWEMSASEIEAVKSKVFPMWYNQYFDKFLWAFIFLCSLSIVLLRKGANKIFSRITLILLFGSWVFLALQFATLKDHDYYIINLFIVPVFILITLIELIHKKFPRLLKSGILIFMMLSFTFYNVNYAKTELNNRYHGWWNNDGAKNDIEDITPYLRSIGITSSDKVISIPDQSHLSLYLMNQKGWTQYAERFYNEGETVYLNRDHEGMESSIRNGAKYLIVNGLKEIYTQPFLHKYAVHLVGQFRYILIFDLQKLDSRNFALPKRQVNKTIMCNAEGLNRTGKYFSSVHGYLLFGNSNTRSDDFAYSGNYSSKLGAGEQYGMTITLDKVFYGESFIVSVMRKKGGDSMSLVISGEGKPKFYMNDYEILETDNPDWEQLKMEVHIPKAMDGRPLKVYLLNSSEDITYGDDLQIVQFQSYYK